MMSDIIEFELRKRLYSRATFKQDSTEYFWKFSAVALTAPATGLTRWRALGPRATVEASLNPFELLRSCIW